jgi:hypothetical protein
VKKVKKILTDENKYKNDGCDFCINAEQTYQTGYIHTLCYYNFCTRKNRNNLCSDFISENELLKEDRQENIFNNYRKIRIKYENMMFNNINLNKYHNRYYEEFSDDTSINFISMYY